MHNSKKDLTPQEKNFLGFVNSYGIDYFIERIEEIQEMMLYGSVIEYELKEVTSNAYFLKELLDTLSPS